ncbi:MAG: SEC-C domain-containing protein [Sandaracinaceae bacterium]|nr:SEC-C domain-containing protein [Sandaracinaceae bacterium]
MIPGFTARRSVEKLGRNDVCHCGSGKKYKKCCMAKDEARAKSLSPVSGLTKEEFEAQAHKHLKAKELDELSPGVLARLPVGELDDEQLAVVFRKMVAFSRMEPARRVLEERLRRGGDAKERDAWRVDVTRLAFDTGRAQLAVETGASIEDRSALPGRLAWRLELSGERGDRLDAIERALRERPEDAVELAHALLHTHAALGIHVARGALEEGKPDANKELMWDIDAARDRLRWSPFDPYWDVHDFLAGLSHVVKAERRANKLAQEEKSKLEAQLQALRERMRDYSTKTVALEKELASRADELEDARKGLERATKAAAAGRDAQQASERARELKLKVDALKAQIAEGNEERRKLRDELAKIEEEREDVEATAQGEPEEVDEGEAEEEVLSVALLAPHFTDGARADMERLPKRIAADAIRAAGELGAGDPPAWRHAKRLQGLGEVYSARLGIHHRMLFRKKDGTLEVFTIVDREDLDKTIAHLR